MKTYWVISALLGLIPVLLRAQVPPPAGGSYCYPNPVYTCGAHVVFTMEEPGEAEVRVYREGFVPAYRVAERRSTGVQQIRLYCGQAPGFYLYRVTLKYDSGRKVDLPTGRFTIYRK